MSVSAAAVVHGFHTFMPKVNIAGVICNRVGGERHAGWLREAITQYSVPVFGCLPYLLDLAIPKRHLGLLNGRRPYRPSWPGCGKRWHVMLTWRRS